jgi:type II secretory pathway pseudopilin PulG
MGLGAFDATRRAGRFGAWAPPIRHRKSAIRNLPGGFSLLEMVTAMGVTSILLLGIGSAMLLAGRAIARGIARGVKALCVNLKSS